jgi:serine/threonine protein kinase
MHGYGIIHRDLKLENIMMTDGSDKAVPKIVDFGLSKILGPSEKATEPFGTLSYCAPEVLKQEPYRYSCDVWSLGCIIYALISGSLPWDHDDQKEVIRMTLHDPLVFDLPVWDRVSLYSKNLITKLLIKDANERITLENALKHEWFSAKI